ncbi:helix-turn-helix domain-containing protein [Micromonospora sp. DR5-3]|uniref:DUF5937 family protein n=1 Tax=unclassified Micromonospora TaxID=2617518 RepID=UPI0011D6472E|nr:MULTISPECIES: DUF5937 family protein [unclassified Micromonospora]MCW3816972.1 helix-turn-helix domain-containing protein [Micromonospora sp. DR5-3]TYC24078.1 helix-turn-helix transcriptional regulator [Micromonospora sp. MP36]
MIVAHLDGATLARVRLALSPASEAVSWIRAATSRFGHPVHGDPGPAARAAVRHPDVALVAQLISPAGRPGYTPDLLTPKSPLGPVDRLFERQVAAAEATPTEEVAVQVGGRFPSGAVPAVVRAAVDSGTLARRAAAGLRRFWRVALADEWPALRRTLEAELAGRATTMATTGVGSLLAGLHPAVGWTGRLLTVDLPQRVTTTMADSELVLTPSALGWPRVEAQLCDSGNAVLFYPLGAARPTARTGDLLGPLVGTSRASILADLDVPRSTHELSDRQDLAPATVSYHLGVLLRAGLVMRQRKGHRVLYHRSPHGQDLLECRSAG